MNNEKKKITKEEEDEGEEDEAKEDSGKYEEEKERKKGLRWFKRYHLAISAFNTKSIQHDIKLTLRIREFF